MPSRRRAHPDTKTNTETHRHQENAMTTKSHAHASNPAPSSQETPMTASTTADPAPAIKPPAPALGYVKPPPTVTIPAVPPGFVAVKEGFRGLVPRLAELAVLPDVLQEMGRFAYYVGVFGKTAPAQDVVEQTLTSAYQWSVLRRQVAELDAYCRSQEGLAWTDARALIDRLKPAFALATTTDAAVASQNPGLRRLFGVAKTAAQRSLATRVANAQSKAKGEPAYAGKAGQARRRRDEKAALAAQRTKATPPPPAGSPTQAEGVASPGGAPVTPANGGSLVLDGTHA